MKCFETNQELQAMGCWALVNIALINAQKAILVRRGGIEAIINAMVRHPYNAEVQFRALFALINLAIPCEYHCIFSSISLFYAPQVLTIRCLMLTADNQSGDSSAQEEDEERPLDKHIHTIAALVVKAMKQFCASLAILNRACLVLHNLSLTDEYSASIMWTPSCYQMLKWCQANYPSDQVLQSSASGTLQRFQQTLSKDTEKRKRFLEFIKSQQQSSLAEAHREAVRLHDLKESISTKQESINSN